MTQTRLGSAIESITNIVLGFVLAVLIQAAFGLSVRQNLALASTFTIVSLVRGYCVRRAFNALHQLHQGVR